MNTFERPDLGPTVENVGEGSGSDHVFRFLFLGEQLAYVDAAADGWQARDGDGQLLPAGFNPDSLVAWGKAMRHALAVRRNRMMQNIQP